MSGPGVMSETMAAPLSLAVAVCTYRWPEGLLACMAGLAAQARLPDEVMLIVRPDDAATHAALRARGPDRLAWRIVAVDRPGLVAARNAALAACTCDIISFCDDDTIASPEWVRRIVERFAGDRRLGGLGGRDRCHDGVAFDDRRRDVVGRLQWFGRPVGNHHLGFGAPREVDFLKGANMSFRMEAARGLRFDERLRGPGAQPHDDLGFSLAVGRGGWRLVYDPAVTLDHYAAPRTQPRSHVASAGLADPQGFYDSCYNMALVLRDHLHGPRRLAWRVWSAAIGMRVCPGLLQALRLTPTEGRVAWRKLALAWRAARAAATATRPPKITSLPAAPARECA